MRDVLGRPLGSHTLIAGPVDWDARAAAADVTWHPLVPGRDACAGYWAGYGEGIQTRGADQLPWLAVAGRDYRTEVGERGRRTSDASLSGYERTNSHRSDENRGRVTVCRPALCGRRHVLGRFVAFAAALAARGVRPRTRCAASRDVSALERGRARGVLDGPAFS